jgi:HAD superfamily hydrolase (TIGR01484 family)
MKKLIVSDVDGTFIDYDENLIQANVEAAKRFCESGNYFTFATGRFTDSLSKIVPGYEKLMNVPGIFSNGAFLSRADGKEKLYPQYLDGKLNLKIIRQLESRWPTAAIRFTNDDGFVWTRGIPDDELDTDRPWHKVVVIDEPEILEEVRAFLETEYNSMFRFMKSSERLFEWQDNLAGKGPMIPRLKEWIKENLGHDCIAYCVGDYENDLEMLEAADVACCPSNAIEAIKKISDIELCDCRDGSIADLVSRLLSEK